MIKGIFFFIFSDSHGQTPAHLAAKAGALHVVELLLADNLFCLNLTDKNQVIPLVLIIGLYCLRN
jgi:ankyrin repeat protein